MNEVLVNPLFKLAQEKVWLGELNVPHDHQLLTLDVKQQNKQMNDPEKFEQFYLATKYKCRPSRQECFKE